MPADPYEIYSQYSGLKEEIERRRKDPELIKKVKDFFNDTPISLEEGPFGMISRTIATPNKEFEYFHDLVQGIELTPLVLEYDGKFVAKNPEKYFLCRLHFCDAKEYENPLIKKIVDFNRWEGEALSSIVTVNGENLLDMHRRFFKASLYADTAKKVDITDWFNKVRKSEEGYYFYFLSLFILHGVLFENYLLEDKEERAFFEEKMYPSFKKVEAFFGVKPLIFPLLPVTHENRKEWLYYPKKLQQVI